MCFGGPAKRDPVVDKEIAIRKEEQAEADIVATRERKTAKSLITENKVQETVAVGATRERQAAGNADIESTKTDPEGVVRGILNPRKATSKTILPKLSVGKKKTSSPFASMGAGNSPFGQSTRGGRGRRSLITGLGGGSGFRTRFF